MGYVLMETEGDLGRFNRAQRALQNVGEQIPMVLANFLAAAFVYPFPSFVLICLFMSLRAVGAFGYTSSAKSRMGGNMLGGLCFEMLQGLVLIAGVKALSG